MKKRINSSLLLISIISLFLSTIIISNIYYRNHLDSEKKYIKEYTISLYDAIKDNPEKIYSFDNDNYRLTIIRRDGIILFDSFKDIRENHSDRLEFIQAKEFGFGEDIRISESLDKNLYYYSILMENGHIFRISTSIDNIYTTINSILPSIIFMIIFIIILSSIISAILGNHIIKPIDKLTDNIEILNMEFDIDTLDIYDELIPLVNKIGQQSYNINRYVDDIKYQKNVLDNIIYNMTDGIILLDKDNNIITMNQSSINLLKNNMDIKDDFIDRPFIEFNRNRLINKNIEDANIKKEDIKYFQNISDRHLYISINPILKNKELYAITILIMDYTNKYNLEKTRREFAANVSHELKTPLTSINGYAQILASDTVKEKDIGRFANIIKSEGDRLLDMIDSIIKISKLENEEDFKEFRDIDLYTITKDILNSIKVLSDSKNINIKLKGESVLIKGNQEMIQECIYNVIDNSIKYNIYGGRIYIKIDKKEDIPFISIKDTGIGIDYDKQDRIFERFYIAEDSRNKNNNSTGLGLSIVKHIVDYHNAIIEFSSIPMKGSEFKIYFPEK